MASTGAVGGSQIDVQGLVSQLVAAERANPDKQIARQTQQVTTQISALGQLMGSLSNFRSALSSLKTVDVFSTRSAVTTNDEIFTATAGTAAIPGSYDIQVEHLAQAQQIASDPFTGGGTSVVGTGSLTLSLGTDSFTIDITSENSTLAQIRDAINSSEDNPGIRATLVQGTAGTQLVLSSSKTGEDNTIEVSQSGGDGGLAVLAYSEAAPDNYTVLKQAQDALAYIAGAEVTSDTNTIENAIDGVTITLKKATAANTPETLTVGYDTDAVKKRIQNFVEAYNALASQTSKLRSYDSVTQTAGPMLGDSLLTSIETELRNSLSSSVADQPEGFQNLASIGITIQLNGTLATDPAKLTKALDTNFEAVGNLFASENGIAARMFKQVDNKLATGNALDTRSKNLTDQQKAIQKRKDDLDVRMLAVQQGYLKQFTRLDTLLSQLQVTSSYMSQQIESLANMNKG